MVPLADDLEKAQSLVGDITGDDLRYVDYYLADKLGIFIPSVGYCQYAIRPRHTHPAYSFVLFFSEQQSIVPKMINLAADHYLVTAMSPQLPHEEEEGDTFTRYVAVFIAPELYHSVYQSYTSDSPKEYFWDQFQVQQDIMVLIKKFIAEYENRHPDFPLTMNALAVLITSQLIRSILGVSVSAEIGAERLELARVVEFIQQNYGQKLSLSKLAGLVNMSESHFTRVFKKETGIAPTEYLISVRLAKAKKLLRAGTNNITEISLLCGFNSTSHFSTCFTKHFGLTPSNYQKDYSKIKGTPAR